MKNYFQRMSKITIILTVALVLLNGAFIGTGFLGGAAMATAGVDADAALYKKLSQVADGKGDATLFEKLKSEIITAKIRF